MRRNATAATATITMVVVLLLLLEEGAVDESEGKGVFEELGIELVGCVTIGTVGMGAFARSGSIARPESSTDAVALATALPPMPGAMVPPSPPAAWPSGTCLACSRKWPILVDGHGATAATSGRRRNERKERSATAAIRQLPPMARPHHRAHSSRSATPAVHNHVLNMQYCN